MEGEQRNVRKQMRNENWRRGLTSPGTKRLNEANQWIKLPVGPIGKRNGYTEVKRQLKPIKKYQLKYFKVSAQLYSLENNNEPSFLQ